MQEHVELEVALEKIMANIAQTIFKLNNVKSDNEKKFLESELKELIKLEETAYKGERKSISKILSKEIKYE